MSSKSTQIGKLAIKNNLPHILTTSPTALTKLKIAASKRENSAPKRDLSTIGLSTTYRWLGGRRSKVGIRRSKTSQLKTHIQAVRNLNNISRSATGFRCKLSVRQMSDLVGQPEKVVVETAAKPFNRHLYDAAMSIFNPKQSVRISKTMEKSFVDNSAITIRDDLMPIDKNTKNLISVRRSQCLTQSESQDTQNADGLRDPLVDKELWSSRYEEYKPRMPSNWDMGNRNNDMGGGRVNLNESSFENAKNIYNAATATRSVAATSTVDRPRIPTCINHRINELFNKQHKQDVLALRLPGTCNANSATKEVASDGNTKKQIHQQLAGAVGGDLATKQKVTQKQKSSAENRHDKNANIELEPAKASFMRVHTQTLARANQQSQVESNPTSSRFDDIHYNNRLQPVTAIATRLFTNNFDENENVGAAQLEQSMPAATANTTVKKTMGEATKARKMLLPLTEADTLQQQQQHQHQQQQRQQQEQQHQKKLSLSRDTPNQTLDVNRVQKMEREALHRMPVPNIRKHLKQTVNAQTANILVQSRKQSTKPNLQQQEQQQQQQQQQQLQQQQQQQQATAAKTRIEPKQSTGSMACKSGRALKSDLGATESKQEEPKTIVRSKSYSSISGVHQILSKPEDSRFSHVRHLRDRKIW